MNPSLKALVDTGVVTTGQARAALAWAADVAEVAPRLPRRPEHVRARAHGVGRGRNASGGHNLMRAAARRRCRKIEDLLAGRGSVWFRAVHHIVLLGTSATETAALLELTMPAFILLAQDGFKGIASVYNFMEGRAA
jgi:hypothetical protein